mmetsp:Transcript_1591/g.2380  ORF Transcript_1591/g.2380 Transcript_1591/m.2380 type:complete len:157 (+) Transcript_1591:138-608(+)
MKIGRYPEFDETKLQYLLIRGSQRCQTDFMNMVACLEAANMCGASCRGHIMRVRECFIRAQKEKTQSSKKLLKSFELFLRNPYKGNMYKNQKMKAFGPSEMRAEKRYAKLKKRQHLKSKTRRIARDQFIYNIESTNDRKRRNTQYPWTKKDQVEAI